MSLKSIFWFPGYKSSVNGISNSALFWKNFKNAIKRYLLHLDINQDGEIIQDGGNFKFDFFFVENCEIKNFWQKL
jgi:hypothetical protein